MDQSERKEKHPSLPPDYVSLAQLQERWLQKQREKEMSEKREKEAREKREKEAREKIEKEAREKREKEAREKIEKEMGEKLKEDSKTQQRIAGFDENQGGLLRNGREVNRGGLLSFNENQRGLLRNGHEKNRGGLLRFDENERGLLRNGHEKNRGGLLRFDENQRGLLRNGHDKNRGGLLRFDENQRGLLRNGHEKNASIQEKENEKEIVIDGSENEKKVCDNNKKGKKNKKKKRDKRKKKPEKEIVIAKEKLESETNKEFNGGIKGVLTGENSGNDELKEPTKEIVNRFDSRGGLSRNGHNSWSGENRKRGGNNRVRFNQLKETEVNLVLEKKMDVKKERNWTWIEKRGNGNNRGGEGHHRLNENGHDVSKADVVEPKLEKKADNENVEAYIEISSLDGGDRNGLSGNDLNRVLEEGVMNDNGSMPDKKADEMVLALKSVGIRENGEVGDGYRRYGNNGRQFGGGHWKANAADRRRYTRPGRFEGRWKMKEKEKSGMMWVKKEDKPGAYGDSTTEAVNAEKRLDSAHLESRRVRSN